MSLLFAEPVLVSDDLAALHALAGQIEAALGGATDAAELGRLRARCVEAVAGHPAGRKDAPSVAAVVRVVELALGAGWSDQPASPDVVAEAERIARQGWTGLLASLLLAPAWQNQALPRFDSVPLFLWRTLALASFRAPVWPTELGQAEGIGRLQLTRLRELVRLMQVNPGASAVREAAAAAASAGDTWALLNSTAGVEERLILRGQLRAALNRRPDAQPLLPLPRAGRRLRIGVLVAAGCGGRALRAALPWFDHLDGARFEVELFSSAELDTAVEAHLAARSISVRRLAGELAEQNRQIASEALDVLLAVVGEPAATSDLAALLADRVAPLQGALNEFGLTSGIAGLDFLLTRSAGAAGRRGGERRLVVAERGVRMMPAALAGEPRQGWTRAGLGFPDDAVIFSSAAPFALLSPEWADRAVRVLRELPAGRLLIYSGAAADADAAAMARLCAVLEPALMRHGVDATRLLISHEPVGCLAEVRALLGLADFHLDTFPLSDSEGCQLALAAGVPLLAVAPPPDGASFAASAARALGLEAGLAGSADELVARAVDFGRDAPRRAQLRAELAAGLVSASAFHDPLALADAVGSMLEWATDLALADEGRSVFAAQPHLTLAGPELVEGSLEEAAILLESGLPGEALPRLAPFFAAHAGQPRVRNLFYSALIQAGQAARAVTGLEAAAERGFAGADTHRLLARAHLWLGRTEAAIAALRISLRLDPKHSDTWAVLTEIAQAGGHHAITEELSHLRAALADSSAAELPAAPRKCLYFSPVGKAGKPFLARMVELFPADQFDFLVVAYDDADFAEFAGRVEVVRDRGQKWRLIKKYLTPDKVAAYDYVFMWDDDLDPTNFAPVAFVDILRRNRIDVAQPSLTADSYSFHPITVAHPGTVGRLTNFVEIMCPVYSSKIWPSIYPYIDPDVNELGWGYDLIPLGRKAIVDCMSVRHTRPGQSANAGAAQQSAAWCEQYQIKRPALVNLWSLS